MANPVTVVTGNAGKLAEFIDATFVLPERGANAARNQAARLLIEANPGLSGDQPIAAGTPIRVPADFPLPLRDGIAILQVGSWSPPIVASSETLATIAANADLAFEQAKREFEATRETLDLAAHNTQDPDITAFIEQSLAASEETIRRAEQVRADRQRQMEALSASAEEFRAFLASVHG